MDGLSQDIWCEEYDTLTHFVLIIDSSPTTFEVAVNESKWRKAIDDEITAI